MEIHEFSAGVYLKSSTRECDATETSTTCGLESSLESRLEGLLSEVLRPSDEAVCLSLRLKNWLRGADTSLRHKLTPVTLLDG